MTRRAVEATDEFYRVRDLPRRTWRDEDAEKLAAMLTEHLRTRYGKYALRPIQALMICEATDVGGLFAACGVGSGKTLPSFLIPTMLKAKRPLLLVQAGLLEKTKRDYAFWAYHFRVHPQLQIDTYERLSVAPKDDGPSLLDRYRPDLVLADEGHRLKNRASARGRRFIRYFNENRTTRFCYFSGGIQRKSLREFWHLICLALPKTAPLPYTFSQLETWAEAVKPPSKDERDELTRFAPGCLLELVDPALDAANDDGRPVDDLTALWRGLRRRLVQTRGVVATAENEVPAELTLHERPIAVPPKVEAALRQLRNTWTTPNGDELTQAVDIWRHARELACGFWYEWHPAPPLEWLEARRAWNRYVRTVLSHHRDGLDSPLQVAKRYHDHPLLRAWLKVKPLYDPTNHKRAVWIDDFLLRDAAAWLNTKGEPPGVVWVEHNTVGVHLSKVTGFPYFGGGDEASAAILDAKGPIIASIAAHGTGKNLQHYSRMLITSCPPSADTIEQLLGRLHRHGQEADEVTGEIYRHCAEVRDGLAQAYQDARYIQETTGMRQKLLSATCTFDLGGPANDDRLIVKASFR